MDTARIDLRAQLIALAQDLQQGSRRTWEPPPSNLADEAAMRWIVEAKQRLGFEAWADASVRAVPWPGTGPEDYQDVISRWEELAGVDRNHGEVSYSVWFDRLMEYAHAAMAVDKEYGEPS